MNEARWAVPNTRPSFALVRTLSHRCACRRLRALVRTLSHCDHRLSGLAQHGLAQHGLAQHSLAQHGLAQHGIAHAFVLFAASSHQGGEGHQ